MLYNYNISYVINLININKLKKNLTFNIFFTKKNLQFVSFLKNFNFIYKYSLIKIDNKTFIKIYLYYYKNKIISNSFKLISKPSKSFFISTNALRLISKKTGLSVFIISNDKGLITHKLSLKNKKGGLVLGFFSF
jgi:ribosomal protein S8